MFEPDGRNSAQYAGHIMMRGFKIATAVIALPVLLLAFVFIYTYFQVQAQRVDFEAYNQDPKVVEATVDFNRASLSMKDLTDEYQFQEDLVRMDTLNKAAKAKEAEGYETEEEMVQNNLAATEMRDASKELVRLSPILSTGAFSVAFLEGKSPKNIATDPRDYKATPMQWVYFALPFHGGIAYDEKYTLASRVGVVNGHGDAPVMDFNVITPVSNEYTQKGEGPGVDPWMDYGLYKLAPTKKWDWSVGRLQIHAKASYNYAAYVAAARMVARIRMVAALAMLNRRPGEDVWAGSVPGAIALSIPEGERQRFVNAYNKVFKGDLPIVNIRVQPLRDLTIQSHMWPSRRNYADFTKDRMSIPMDPNESGDWGEYHRWYNYMGTTDLFMTGMRLPKTDADAGRVEHSLGDIFFNSHPHLNSDARAAQRELWKLTTYQFWEPLLDKYGLQDQKDVVKAIINEENKALDYDLGFAHANAHLAYRISANDDVF